MAKNGTQLVAGTRSRIDDQKADATVLLGFINEAIFDLSAVLRLEKTHSFNVLANQAEYLLPSDLVEPIAVKLASESRAREPVDLTDYDSTGFKLWEGSLVLQPTPSLATTGKLYYYRLAPAIAIGDTPEVPEHFEHLLELYAASMWLMRDEELELAKVGYWRDYERGRAMLGQFTARKARFSRPKDWTVYRR